MMAGCYNAYVRFIKHVETFLRFLFRKLGTCRTSSHDAHRGTLRFMKMMMNIDATTSHVMYRSRSCCTSCTVYTRRHDFARYRTFWLYILRRHRFRHTGMCMTTTTCILLSLLCYISHNDHLVDCIISPEDGSRHVVESVYHTWHRKYVE